jgi:hypothetical protein
MFKSISTENCSASSAFATTRKPLASTSSVVQVLSEQILIDVTGHSFLGKIALAVEKTFNRLKVSQSVVSDLNLSIPAKKALVGSSLVMT